MKLLLIPLALVGLSACATAPEPKIKTVEVQVPIAHVCVPASVPGKPASYADDKAGAMTPEDRYLAIAQANAERKSRLAVLEPVVLACR